MARRKTRTLTELELELMHVIWNRGEAVVEDLRHDLADAGKPLALPTIRTMLAILQEKGYLTRRPEGRGFAYRACVSQDEARKSILRDIVDRAFQGSALGLVASLLGSRMVGHAELDQVRKLLEQAEKEKKP